MKIPTESGVMGRHVERIDIIKHEEEKLMMVQLYPRDRTTNTEAILMTLDEAERLAREINSLLESDRKVGWTIYRP